MYDRLLVEVKFDFSCGESKIRIDKETAIWAAYRSVYFEA